MIIVVNVVYRPVTLLYREATDRLPETVVWIYRPFLHFFPNFLAYLKIFKVEFGFTVGACHKKRIFWLILYPKILFQLPDSSLAVTLKS